MKHILSLAIVLLFILSCKNEEPLFEDCVFPYPLLSFTNGNSEDVIQEEELPIEIVETVRDKYTNIEEINGGVIFHCTRENLLYVVTAFTESTIDEFGNEIETTFVAFDLYNSCGEFVGDGLDINTGTGQDAYEDYIESILGENVFHIFDVTVYDFIDGKREYYVDVSVAEGKLHFLIDEESGEFCELN